MRFQQLIRYLLLSFENFILVVDILAINVNVVVRDWKVNWLSDFSKKRASNEIDLFTSTTIIIVILNDSTSSTSIQSIFSVAVLTSRWIAQISTDQFSNYMVQKLIGVVE